jgi:hypothetical protein
MSKEDSYSMVEQVKIARHISAGLKPSLRWQKLEKVQMPEVVADDPDCECFENDIYECTLRKFKDGWALGGGRWAQIGISSKDGAPRHDWREFQKIKNDLVGTNWEAVELYPDEQRLLDPSNYYILWCAPKIPVGKFIGREIRNETNCIAPQRPFAK